MDAKTLRRVFDQKGSVSINPVGYLSCLRRVTEDLLDLHLEDTSCAGHNQIELRSLFAGDPLDHCLVQGIGNVRIELKWVYRPLLTTLSRCAVLNDASSKNRTIVSEIRACCVSGKRSLSVRVQLKKIWARAGSDYPVAQSPSLTLSTVFPRRTTTLIHSTGTFIASDCNFTATLGTGVLPRYTQTIRDAPEILQKGVLSGY